MLMTAEQLFAADHAVRAFLRTADRRRTINYNLSSYGWKHIVEQWSVIVFGRHIYIPNALFIDIAQSMGIRSERCEPDSPNWWFALRSPEWPSQ